MPRLINVKHTDVVVLGLSLRLLVNHGRSKEAPKLIVSDGIAKVRKEPLIERLLALGKGE